MGSDSKRRRFTVDSLLSDSRPRAVGVADLADAKLINLDRIQPDPAQPRTHFDQDRLEELAASIRREGILQPIAVRYDETRDLYVVLHGERRWRAAQLAGLIAIPAIVREVPAEHRLIQQLMENIVRDDLNAVDRAAALRALKGQLGDASWDVVAESVGIKRSRLFQLLDTEKLPDSVQDDLRAGRLSEKQTRAMQSLPALVQSILAPEIIARKLSAPRVSAIAKHVQGNPVPATATAIEAAIAEAIAATETPQKPAKKRDVPAPVLDFSPISRDESLALLVALADSADSADLRQRADKASAAPFNEDRLVAEIRALARTLARHRLAAVELSPFAATALAALNAALESRDRER